MTRVLQGLLVDPGGRFAIVASRFNEFVVGRLVEGAVDGFSRHGIERDRVDLIWVPGAFELPLAVSKVIATGRYAAVVACGAVIRGATSHFDYVAGPAANGLAKVSLDTGVPVVLALLTTDTIEQAIERSGSKAGNKGFEGACTAIEMVSLLGRLEA